MCDIRKKMLPVGIESFEEIRTDEYYYVDKTSLIEDLLRRRGKVNLFTRPRRFGKSLNMSMLKYFFEIGCDRTLFEGLKILKETELCDKYMGKFPVISISLKSVNGADFATARSLMCSTIGNEAMRFYNLLDSEKITGEEKEMYRKLIKVTPDKPDNFHMSDDVLMGSLKTLSRLLQRHYDQKVVILIDEYDVPLAKANEQGYYDQMVLLLRNMFEQVLKTNDSLYFAVLTGCLRVAKESIFTGLNNPKIFSITSVRFDEYFGFTDDEVRKMLEYYNLSEKYDTTKSWYDGYRFGNVDVYCPWDVISYCDELLDEPSLEPKDYWSNTSSNDVVERFIEKLGDGVTKTEIERLIGGETVTKEIHQELTYKELYDSIDNLWSVLFTTGYLTQRSKSKGDNFNLVIPNMEIRKIFTGQIVKMFRADVEKDGSALKSFCRALLDGDAAAVENQFMSYMDKTISVRDTFARKPIKENFYHGLLLGILGFKEGWTVSSNKEAGDGYNDIQIQVDDEDIGIVIEVKYAQNGHLENECRKALMQIDDERYTNELHRAGIHTILKYGIACYKKNCKVMLVKE